MSFDRTWRAATIALAAALIGLFAVAQVASAQVIIPPPASTGTWINPAPTPFLNSPFGLSAGTLSLDYARFIPSVGTDGNQFGGNGAGLWMFSDNLGLNTDFGYHNITRALAPHLGNTTADAALVWRGPDFRLGPSFGYQGNAQAAGLSTKTYNYGGYGDYFASPIFTFSGKGGSFNTRPGSAGYYFGGLAKAYPDPNFVFNGGIDYTKFTRLRGSSETDYSAGVEYLFSGSAPLSVFGRYSYSAFSPGNFNVNTVTVGLKLHFNANGATTLVDRERTGTLDPFSPLVTAVQFKF